MLILELFFDGPGATCRDMARVIGRDTPPTPRKRRWTRIKDEEMPEPILIADDYGHLRKSPAKRLKLSNHIGIKDEDLPLKEEDGGMGYAEGYAEAIEAIDFLLGGLRDLVASVPISRFNRTIREDFPGGKRR